MNFEVSEKYNFPPVSNQPTQKDCLQRQRATSSRLSKHSTWRNPLAFARSNKLSLSSRSEKSSTPIRSGRGHNYGCPNSPRGNRKLGKTPDGFDEIVSDRGVSPCFRRTMENITQPKQLVSKLTVHVVK